MWFDPQYHIQDKLNSIIAQIKGVCVCVSMHYRVCRFWQVDDAHLFSGAVTLSAADQYQIGNDVKSTPCAFVIMQNVRLLSKITPAFHK